MIDGLDPVDVATPGRWRAEHGMVLTKVENVETFVALVELPRARGNDAKRVLREQDANAALMAHAKQMYFLLDQAERQLTHRSQPEWKIIEEIRLLQQSVKAALS